MSALDRDRGLEALRRGDTRAAVEHLRRAAAAAPAEASTWGYLGVAYGRLGNSAAALQCLDHAVTLAPGSAGLHYNLGLALEQAGRAEAAAARFRQAIALDPGHAPSREALSRLNERSRPEAATEAPPAAPAVAPPAPALVAPAPVAPGVPHVARAMAPGAQAAARQPLSRGGRLLLAAGAAAVFAVVLLLGGAGWIYLTERLRTLPIPVGTVESPVAPPTQAREPVSIEVPSTGLQELTPYPSRMGLQVCDPVPRGADAETAAFGAGCGRWLQYNIAAHPDLGRTPLWTSANTVCRTLGTTHLRVTAKDAPYLATSLGVTHAALGEIRGSGQRCTLTYRLIEVPSGKAVGAPLRVSGSRAQVLARLPALARTLTQRLRVKPERVPAAVRESASDLSFLGSLPWVPVETIGKEATHRLVELSQQGGLSTMYFVMNRALVEDYTSLLDAIEPLERDLEHPLALAQYALALDGTGATMGPRFPRALHRAVSIYPSSYLLRMALSGCQQQEKKYRQAIEEAQYAVRYNFTSPTAWAILGDRYANWANTIRRGRPINQMQPDELAACEKLYPFWLEAAYRAAELDPRNMTIGLGLSSAAAFCGDAELADEAFTRVFQRYPDQPAVYRWGLQLYHPKWYADGQKAAKLAKAAAKAGARSDDWSPADRTDIAFFTHLLGYPDLARRIVRTPIERNQYLQHVERQSHMVVDLGRQ